MRITIFLLCLLFELAAVPSFGTAKQVLPSDESIPYPQALDDAALRLPRSDRLIEDALILGNGDINALVYTSVEAVWMNLTKNDVWDARLLTENDPPLPTLELIKRLGKSDAFPMKDNNRGFVLPEGLVWEDADSYSSHPFPCPRSCARVLIGQDSNETPTAPVPAELDLHRAVASIESSPSGPPSARIRALMQQNVFLIETDAPVRLLPVLSESIPPAEENESQGVTVLTQTLPGDPDWPGMEFSVALAASEHWKAVSIVTSHESKNPAREAIRLARRVLSGRMEKQIQQHESEWDRFWSQSGLLLDDPVLQRNWYRSLYFLRCVSKPGVESVGLFAGLVNDTPAWHGDYHTNYNVQQTYWAAYPTNHSDLAEPYDRLMEAYLPRAEWLSKQVFSLPGAYYPHVLYAFEPTHPEACRSRNGRQYLHHTWGMTLGVNGFSIQPAWWRYKYDPDPRRLKRDIYPMLRAVARFYAGFIEQCDGDPVRLGPTVSPEHWGWTKHLERNYNCAFDIAMIRYTLSAAIEAAQILQRDKEDVRRFHAALQKLPPYPLYGETNPIVVDVEGAPPIEYNIAVPATPVFPCDVVTWWSEESEKALFARTIEPLKWNGNNSIVILAVARARLSMPGTLEWLRREVELRSRPNGTLTLNRLDPPHDFNQFGHYTEQFGTAMAVSELLLQSVGDVLRLFPALDPNTSARFTQLRAQGGFLVSAAIEKGNVGMIEVQSLYGGRLRLLSPWPSISARKEDSDREQPLVPDARGIVSMDTKAGETWLFDNPNTTARRASPNQSYP